MPSDIAFPVYVLAKDCGEITIFCDLERMQWHFEPIDVENSEYEAWDSNGRILTMNVGPRKSEWLQVRRTDGVLPKEQFEYMKCRATPYREPEPLLRVIGRKLGLLRADG